MVSSKRLSARELLLKLHAGAALNNGLTKEEIGEVLLPTTAYCGIPAAEESFRIAQEAFRERGM